MLAVHDKTIVNTEVTHDVMTTLIYFSIFQYPLTIEEVASYSKFSIEKIQEAMIVLIERELIFKFDQFYTLDNDISKIKRRILGNQKALQLEGTANSYSKFISKFPFVRGVYLSGSISKGYFGEKDDIDYFVIAASNRIWLCKTFLILFKKIFLLNSKKYFCINYMMSLDKLNVFEKNRFTATEFVTLKPMFDTGIYNKLKKENMWIQEYFPKYNLNKEPIVLQPSFFKKGLESILKNRFGNSLDNFCMKITKAHQKRKFQKMNSKDFNLAFKGDKKVAKHHPDNHQIKVIQKLNKKIEYYNTEFDLSIPFES